MGLTWEVSPKLGSEGFVDNQLLRVSMTRVKCVKSTHVNELRTKIACVKHIVMLKLYYTDSTGWVCLGSVGLVRRVWSGFLFGSVDSGLIYRWRPEDVCWRQDSLCN